MKRVVFSLLVGAALLGVGCDRGPKPSESGGESTSASTMSGSTAEAPSTMGEAPSAMVEAPSPAADPARANGPDQAGGLTWDVAAPLQRETPSSAMRAAQYGVQASGAAKAALTVFYFGPGAGGGAEANITRWKGQFAEPTVEESERTVNGMPAKVIDATGQFNGMQMPGRPAPDSVTNARMLAAVVTGPNGHVFFKLVGPKASVDAGAAAFNALIDSVRPATGPARGETAMVAAPHP